MQRRLQIYVRSHIIIADLRGAATGRCVRVRARPRMARVCAHANGIPIVLSNYITSVREKFAVRREVRFSVNILGALAYRRGNTLKFLTLPFLLSPTPLRLSPLFLPRVISSSGRIVFALNVNFRRIIRPSNYLFDGRFHRTIERESARRNGRARAHTHRTIDGIFFSLANRGRGEIM